MTMNVHIQRTISALGIAGTLASAAWLGTAIGHASPGTINLTDVPNIDALPVCQVEDGSDSASLPCLWFDPDSQDTYLTFEDYSLRIVDDTVAWSGGIR